MLLRAKLELNRVQTHDIDHGETLFPNAFTSFHSLFITVGQLVRVTTQPRRLEFYGSQQIGMSLAAVYTGELGAWTCCNINAQSMLSDSYFRQLSESVQKPQSEARKEKKKCKKKLFGGELNPGRPRSVVMTGGNTYHYTTKDVILFVL